MPDPDLAKAVVVARRAVEAASAASLVYFERGVRVEVKSDLTPVTQGRPTHASGSCVASNGLLHDHVLRALAAH